MPRGQDLLDEAIALISGAGQNELADRLTAQREKFFFAISVFRHGFLVI